MITITFISTDKRLLSTEVAPDILKDELFEAYMDKAPWMVCNIAYQMVGLKASPASAASQTLAVACKRP